MVCRETHLGSAMTSYVKILDGIEEYQSLSLYHELIRESPAGIDSAPTLDRHRFVNEMIEKVEGSTSFTRARKRSLIRRLEAGVHADMAGNLFYATQRIEERAHLAKLALDDYYGNTARSLGLSVNQVRGRMAASYEESKRERTLQAPREWATEFTSRPGQASLPMDRHTAYAMWRLDTEIATQDVAAETTPTVTNHRRLNGTGVSAAGYDAETGRMEIEMRSRAGSYYAYRDVSPALAHELMTSPNPTSVFNARIRNNPDHLYADQATADAAAVRRRCASCGQFAGGDHGCPPRGSAEEELRMMERSRVQQSIARARAAVASGTVEERIARHTADNRPVEVARDLVAAEDRLAAASPDTTTAVRTNQRLHARIYPYRGESGTFRCTALSTVRRILETENQTHVPVTARVHAVDDGTGRARTTDIGVVSGRVTVGLQAASDEAGQRYTVNAYEGPATAEDQLRCTCLVYRRTYDCEHVRQTIGDMQRRLNQRYLVDRHTIADTVARVEAEAAVEHAESLAGQVAAQEAHAVAVAETVSYVEDPRAFQAEYEAAKARLAAGEQVVPYMTENATGGLGARGTGRAFGVELEFDLPHDIDDYERNEIIETIGRDLYEAGLTRVPYQQDYHSAQGEGYTENHQGGWSFEDDCSVSGEIVSPIMYDEPQTWTNLRQVCEIVTRNGGIVNTTTGSHVHVSTGDYDHTVENHNRLLQSMNEYEDVIYRMATNPERGTHRNSEYAMPNRPTPAAGYTDIAAAARGNRGYTAINMANQLYGDSDDHAEYRVWDGTLDPAVIQSQVKMSLAITESAFRDTSYTPGPAEPVGSHRSANTAARAASQSTRLTGEQWRADTAKFRSFVDKVFTRPEDKAQMTALFAWSKWQRPAQRRPQ